MLKRLLLPSLILLFPISMTHAMEQDQPPAKRQKTEETTQVAPLKLSDYCLRAVAQSDSCIQTIAKKDPAPIKSILEQLITQDTISNENKKLLLSQLQQLRPRSSSLSERCLNVIAQHPASEKLQSDNSITTVTTPIGNDVMAFLTSPYEDIKNMIIPYLNTDFINHFESNLVELIIENKVSDDNKILLIDKLPLEVIDNQLGSCIFSNEQPVSVRAHLLRTVSDEYIQEKDTEITNLYNNKTTHHDIRCAISEHISLETVTDFHCFVRLAEHGPITQRMTELVAQMGNHMFLTTLAKNPAALKNGNEELLRTASAQLLSHFVAQTTIIAPLHKEVSKEDEQRIKQYGMARQIIDNQATIQAVDPSGQYRAILDMILEQEFATIRIERMQDAMLMVKLIVPLKDYTSMVWSDNGNHLILCVNNNDISEYHTLNTFYKIFNQSLSLKHIAYYLAYIETQDKDFSFVNEGTIRLPFKNEEHLASNYENQSQLDLEQINRTNYLPIKKSFTSMCPGMTLEEIYDFIEKLPRKDKKQEESLTNLSQTVEKIIQIEKEEQNQAQ